MGYSEFNCLSKWSTVSTTWPGAFWPGALWTMWTISFHMVHIVHKLQFIQWCICIQYHANACGRAGKCGLSTLSTNINQCLYAYVFMCLHAYMLTCLHAYVLM